MKVLVACIMGVSALIALSSASQAREVVAVCSLIVDGRKVWNGKCCVTASVEPSDKSVTLRAEGWQACLYRKRHPANEKLPTYKQKCFGPWINILQENDRASSRESQYSAYWSIEDACHGGKIFPARRNGNIYHGDKFIFEWHEAR